MTNLEKQIIELITKNQHFSEELKSKYILSMFLMGTEKQEEYLGLLQAFTKRCKEMDKGIFVVKPSEMQQVMRTYEEVKKDLFKKLNNNNKN